MSIVGLAQKTW